MESNSKKAIKTLRKSFLRKSWSKKYSKFSYCYTGLGAGCSTKEAITASFVEHFNENEGNTICVYFAVVI